MIHLKLGEVGPRTVSLHPIAQSPPQLVRYPPPWEVLTHRPLTMMSLWMEVWRIPPFTGKGKEVMAAGVAEVVKSPTALTPLNPLPLGEAGERRKMGFLVKSKSQSLGEKGVIWVRSLMPSDNGLGASPTTGTTMRTLT